MTIANAAAGNNEENYEFTVEEAKGILKVKNLEAKGSKGSKDHQIGILFTDEFEQALQI